MNLYDVGLAQVPPQARPGRCRQWEASGPRCRTACPGGNHGRLRARQNTRMNLTHTLAIAVSAVSVLVAGQGQKTIDPAAQGAVTPGAGVAIRPATHAGRPGLRVAEQVTNAGGTLVFLNGVTFENGTIETEIAALPAAGSLESARGFAGIAFRVQDEPRRFECFYLRPTNGRADDQLRRNHSTQYISHPEYPWQRLRREHPGVYESYVDLEPGVWTRLRIVVSGTRARLYVHAADQPTLLVNDLKLPQQAGGIALWIGPGTEAYFGRVTITPAN